MINKMETVIIKKLSLFFKRYLLLNYIVKAGKTHITKFVLVYSLLSFCLFIDLPICSSQCSVQKNDSTTVQFDFHMNNIWHSFLLKDSIQKQVYTKMKEILCGSGYFLLPTCDLKRKSFAIMSMEYSEENAGQYRIKNNYVSATAIKISIHLKTSSGVKTTWESVLLNYDPPSNFTSLGAPSALDLRNDAFQYVWENIPILTQTNTFTPFLKKINSIPKQEMQAYLSSGEVPTGKSCRIVAKSDSYPLPINDSIFFIYSFAIPPSSSFFYLLNVNVNSRKTIWEWQGSDKIYEITDNLVTFPNDSGLIAVDLRTGKTAWKDIIDYNNFNTLSKVGDGLLLTGDWGKTGYCGYINPHNGQLKWKYNLSNRFPGKPAFDSISVYLFNAGQLQRISLKTGKVFWSMSSYLKNPAYQPLIIESKFITDDISGMNAIDLKKKTIAWHFLHPGIKLASNFIYWNKMIIFYLDDGFCYALNSLDGKLVWKRKLKERGLNDSSHMALVDGVLYVPTINGIFFALNPEDGNILWTRELEKSCWSGPIIRNGKIWISSGGNLYCIK